MRISRNVSVWNSTTSPTCCTISKGCDWHGALLLTWSISTGHLCICRHSWHWGTSSSLKHRSDAGLYLSQFACLRWAEACHYPGVSFLAHSVFTRHLVHWFLEPAHRYTLSVSSLSIAECDQTWLLFGHHNHWFSLPQHHRQVPALIDTRPAAHTQWYIGINW